MSNPLELIWINRPITHTGHFMRPHSHMCYQLYYYLSADKAKVFHLGEKHITIARGCSILIPPYTQHFTEPSNSDIITYELKLIINDPFLRDHLPPFPSPLYDEGHSEDIFEYIFTNWMSHDAQIIQNITAFLYAFLLRFCISETHEAPAFSHFIFTDAYSAITRKTIAYLEQYFSNSFSLDSLSEYINYNKSYLCTVFKRETGYSIIEYLTFVRIRNAVISFIFYGDTISSVRESSGFVSAVHFGRVFKELLGVTPREFRSVFQSLSSRDVASIFPKNPIVNYHISSLEEAMDALRSIGETVILRLDAGKKAAGSESSL